MSTLQADSKFKWLDKIVGNLLLALSKSEGFNADKFRQRRVLERTDKKK